MGPAICLIIMTYAGCDATTLMVMLILALTFNGAACQTSLVNHQDLAPNFAGSLYGVMNTFGSFSGFIIPPIIGALTNERVCSPLSKVQIRENMLLILTAFFNNIHLFYRMEWKNGVLFSGYRQEYLFRQQFYFGSLDLRKYSPGTT